MRNEGHPDIVARAAAGGLAFAPAGGLEVIDRYFKVHLPSRSSTFQVYVRQVTNLAATGTIDLLLVHGMAHNNLVYSRLIERLVQLDARIRRVYAVDLPGHGRSGFPTEVKFGDLSLVDYVTTLVEVMKSIGPLPLLVGHSLGGLCLMMLEEHLRGQDQTLEQRFGTRAIALLAPTPPEEVSWGLAEGKLFKNGLISDLLLELTPYVAYSSALGLHAALSDADHVRLFYTNTRGEVASGAPSGEILSGLNDLEAYRAASEMGGLDVKRGDMFQRPHITPGIFSSYALGLASFSEDLYLLPPEEEALFQFLTSGRDGLYLPVTDREAVHCSLFSSPGWLDPLFTWLLQRL